MSDDGTSVITSAFYAENLGGDAEAAVPVARVGPVLYPQDRCGRGAINLLAIHNYARSIASLRDRGGNYRQVLSAGAEDYRTQVRSWISGAGADSRFSEFMDSFVRRSDKRHASALAAALEEADSTVEDTVAAWNGYQRCSTDAEKQVFVENYRHTQKAAGA
ncbi:MAG TPA: hypothetical protein VGD71_33825 [Kribbella sp.]|jgi:hypothetical protein